MARIQVTQTIILNYTIDKDDKKVPQSITLERGKLNEVPNDLLAHPYLQAHMKAGSVSLIPDPLDPEDIAAAAEKIAIEARARANAAKALKDAEDAKKTAAMDEAAKAALTPAADQTPVEHDAEAAKKHAEEEEFQRLLHAEEAAAKAAAETPAAA